MFRKIIIIVGLCLGLFLVPVASAQADCGIRIGLPIFDPCCRPILSALFPCYPYRCCRYPCYACRPVCVVPRPACVAPAPCASCPAAPVILQPSAYPATPAVPTYSLPSLTPHPSN